MLSNKKKNNSSVSSPSLIKRGNKMLANILNPKKQVSANSTVSLRTDDSSASNTPSFDRKQSSLNSRTLHAARPGDSISSTSSYSSLYTPTGSYRFSPNTSVDSAVQLWVRSEYAN